MLERELQEEQTGVLQPKDENEGLLQTGSLSQVIRSCFLLLQQRVWVVFMPLKGFNTSFPVEHDLSEHLSLMPDKRGPKHHKGAPASRKPKAD